MAPKTTSKKSPKKAPVKKVAVKKAPVKKVTSKKAPVKKSPKKEIPQALRQWHSELDKYIKVHPSVSRKVAMMKVSELRQKKGGVKKSVKKSAPKFCKAGKVMIVNKCYKYCPEGKIRNPKTRKCRSVKRVIYEGDVDLPEMRFPMSPRKGSVQLP